MHLLMKHASSRQHERCQENQLSSQRRFSSCRQEKFKSVHMSIAGQSDSDIFKMHYVFWSTPCAVDSKNKKECLPLFLHGLPVCLTLA